MKQSINKWEFQQLFEACGRGQQFSASALDALFDYLEEYEETCGVEVELDVVALCCEFSEYDSALDCVTMQGYAFEPDEDEDEDEQEIAALDWLRDHTSVIEFPGGIIILEF
jgi:hypothetical protein